MSVESHFHDHQEQTKVKHDVLKRYLRTWATILQKYNKKLAYIDGFAGTGQYGQDGKGSPVLALEIAGEMKGRFRTSLGCIFIESDKGQFDKLSEHLEATRFKRNQDYWLYNESFEGYLDQFLFSKRRVVPAFFFVDPCGWTGFGMTSLKRILSYKKTEVLINFMYNSISRFLTFGDWWEDVFGMSSQEISTLRDQVRSLSSQQREDFILNTYISRLKSIAGADYVRKFRIWMPGKSRTYFYLIHCCNHPKGHEVMKQVMWGLSDQDYTFSALHVDAAESSGQLLLDDGEYIHEYYGDRLRQYLLSKFKGRSVSFDTIVESTSEETDYLTKHYREQLKQLERNSLVEVTRLDSKPGGNGIRGRDLIQFH